MNAAVIISISVFISLIFLFSGIFSYYDERRKRREIVGKIRGPEDRLSLDKESEYGTQGEEQPGGYFYVLISSLGQRIKPKDETEMSRMRIKLTQAGYRRQHAPLFFFGYKVFFSVLLAVLFSLSKVFLLTTIQPGAFTTVTVMLGLLGFYLPNFWLKIKTGARQEKILKDFPDALDLMVVCVEAGLGLDAAINRVGEEMKLRNALISEEFRLLGLEMRAGKLRRDALHNLGLRTGLEEVKSLMTLLIQTDKFGTSIGQALRVHSDSMRTTRMQKAEEKAAKLPVKLVFPLILCIFPALFVVIVGPAVIKIYRVLLPAMGG
ncbi:MAG: type II secretion system F family protein [Thermodesulfovibrionales bacterium]